MLDFLEWCITCSQEDADSTSMDELLLEASETLKMSQNTYPDSRTLLPTVPSSVDLSILKSNGTSSTQLESAN